MIPKEHPAKQQQSSAPAVVSSRRKTYIRDSRKKKLPHQTTLVKTILLTDVFSALDFSHTINKDKYTSKYMNNTIQKRKLGGG